MLVFNILTLFPDTVSCFFQESIVKRAVDRGLIEPRVFNIRDFSRDRHQKVDDYPFGGGRGMLMTPDPLFRAVEGLEAKGKVIYLSPMGKLLNQTAVRILAREDCLTLICGHYEGIDHRVVEHLVDEEFSVGDYIMTCGEIAAAALVDAVTRELEGALGNSTSRLEESFDATGLLEYEQYTRPARYREYDVPEILLSGNHEEIRKWRMKRRLVNTLERRPDLLNSAFLTDEYKELLNEVVKEKKDERG